jgi:NADH:ubiquinone oxidoreductase subunit D
MAISWGSVGHFFASGFRDVQVVAKAVAVEVAKLGAAAPTVEALTSLVSPQAADVERLAFAALGEIASVIQHVDVAAGAGGVNVNLDAQLVADIKALVAYFPQLVSQAEQIFKAK